ncbi:hypothetical protein RHGRI_036533 [Rhododendron griersonianum]|uniref:Uncharacterized protein n=1 Tax=Rhododendron griersonianum TaxID=479676 RepID=A0AAV6HSK0_9ERIC|nr:hypothetical protein RHGRI_036533 [Rhododendron griersonianum]
MDGGNHRTAVEALGRAVLGGSEAAQAAGKGGGEAEIRKRTWSRGGWGGGDMREERIRKHLTRRNEHHMQMISKKTLQGKYS